MKPRQSLLAQRVFVVREIAENRRQMLLVLLIILTAARLAQ